MSKIICEICGTKYLDTAACCPICGWKQEPKTEETSASDEFELDFLNSEEKEETEKLADVASEESFDLDLDSPEEEKPVVLKKPVNNKKKEAFDFDAVNAGKPAKRSKKPAPVEEEPEEEEEEEEESRSNPFLVIILVILIVALLATSGFIFWKYYLNGGDDEFDDLSYYETEETTEETEEETTLPTVPCTGLSLVSGIDDLTSEGQFWLLHVKASPEDTTDVITYSSADPSIVTVNEEGRVTAVNEGETKIIITCGGETVEAPVVVRFEEAGEAETAAATESEVFIEAEEEEMTEATEAEETEEEEGEQEEEETAADVDPNVVLKLKRTDLTFGIRGVYATLELENGLKPDQVTFSSRNTNVATVNAKGEVTAAGPGLTVITVTYGTQSVECIIRCNF